MPRSPMARRRVGVLLGDEPGIEEAAPGAGAVVGCDSRGRSLDADRREAHVRHPSHDPPADDG